MKVYIDNGTTMNLDCIIDGKDISSNYINSDCGISNNYGKIFMPYDLFLYYKEYFELIVKNHQLEFKVPNSNAFFELESNKAYESEMLFLQRERQYNHLLQKNLKKWVFLKRSIRTAEKIAQARTPKTIETVYRSSVGKYWLYTAGSPLSPVSRYISTAGKYINGEDITAINYTQLYDWFLTRLGEDALKDYKTELIWSDVPFNVKIYGIYRIQYKKAFIEFKDEKKASIKATSYLIKNNYDSYDVIKTIIQLDPNSIQNPQVYAHKIYNAALKI